MRSPSSSGGDALIGAGVAIAGAALALKVFSGTVPPIDPVPPAPPPAPAPTPPPAPVVPEFNADRFLQWFRSQVPAPPHFPLPTPPAPPSELDLSQMSPEQWRSAIGDRVYQVIYLFPDGSRGSCGSFPIAPNRLATALHCTPVDQVEIRTPDNSQSWSASLIWQDAANDLAILEVQGANFQPFSIAVAQPGEPVWAFGYPDVSGGRLAVTPSQVVSTDRPGGALNRAVEVLPETLHPGNSGGPLLNRRGEVVGVAHAIARNPPIIGWAIPAELLPR